MNRNWEIVPFVGAGPVRFGMTRREVRSILGPNFTTFRKTAASLRDTDSYGALAAHLYYDGNERLEYVEIFEPAKVNYSGVNLLGRPVDEVSRELQRVNLCPREEAESVFFDKEGFALIVVEERVDGVSVFSRGYYE